MKKHLYPTLVLVLTLIMGVGYGCAKDKLQGAAVTPNAAGGYQAGQNGVPAVDLGGTESADKLYSRAGWTVQEQQAADFISNAKIYFYYDRFDLSEEAKAILRQKAGKMKEVPQLRVVIEGHCDERGTEEYNIALGERRARAAYDYLIQLGVPAASLDFVSFGKLHPAAMGHNEAAWSQNRRDEFKVTKR